MKKIISMICLITIIFCLTGCSRQTEFYNNRDKNDFQNGAVIKFKILQFRDVMDEKTIKEMNLSGGFFICLGSISAQSKETTEVLNVYYMYVKNKNDGIYFAEIPADKVRIYEDAKDEPYLVGNATLEYMFSGFDTVIDTNKEDSWDDYNRFNLHVPKGTIIPRIDFNFDVNNIKTKK